MVARARRAYIAAVFVPTDIPHSLSHEEAHGRLRARVGDLPVHNHGEGTDIKTGWSDEDYGAVSVVLPFVPSTIERKAGTLLLLGDRRDA